MSKAFFKHAAWEILNKLSSRETIRAKDLVSFAIYQLVTNGTWNGKVINFRSGGHWSLKYMRELGLVKSQKGYYITELGLDLIEHGQGNLFNVMEKWAKVYRKKYYDDKKKASPEPEPKNPQQIEEQEEPIHEEKDDKSGQIVVDFDGIKIAGTPSECAEFVKDMRQSA